MYIHMQYIFIYILLLIRPFAQFCTFFRGIRVYFVKRINVYTSFGGTVLGQDY